MTTCKKDYILIASVFRNQLEYYKSQESEVDIKKRNYITDSILLIKSIGLDLSEAFEKEDATFNRVTFMNDCGFVWLHMLNIYIVKN